MIAYPNSITLTLTNDDSAPTADVLVLDGGRPFISVKLDNWTTFHPPGTGKPNAAYARALAAVLIKAADDLDALLATEPAPAPTPEPEVSL